MKGQTPAITAVLITTVIVGSVATAYVWGTPLLEKRQGKADLQRVETDALSLHSKILQVAESGQGTTEKVKIEGGNNGVQIRLNEDQDYIEITTEGEQPPYPLDSWTLIKGKTLQNLSFGTGSYGIKGDDLPGVIAVRPAGGAGSFVTSYRIEFRNLLAETPTGQRLQKIDLVTEGRSRTTDSATLLISNQGTDLDSGNNRVTLSTGEKMERTRTVVEIDMR